MKDESEYFRDKAKDLQYEEAADDLSDNLSNYSQDEDKHIRVIDIEGTRH